MRKSLFFCLLWAVVCVPNVWAQQGGGQGGGQQGGGNTGGAGGGQGGGQGGQTGGQQPGRSGQNDPFGQQQQQDRMQQERPVFLSGKVVLEDGTPPAEPAVVERVCNGQAHPEAYTDSKGNFSFQLGGDQTLAITDASVSGGGIRGAGGGFGGGNDPFGGGGGFGSPSGGMGQVNLSGCDLRAQLSGYRSDNIQLGRRSVFDNPDVGIIVLRRLDGVTGTAVSATSLNAPKEAKKAYENGVKEMRKKKASPEKAVKEFEKAVAAYPQYAAAWSALGLLRLAAENTEGAQEAFERALEADPKYLNPYQPLVKLHLMASRWEPAAELTDQALRLNPHMTDMQYFKAVAHYNAGNLEEAEKAALTVQEGKDAKDFPQTHQILGMIHSQKGNFGGAATEYRAYLSAQPNGATAEDLKRRLNEWEALGVIPKGTAAPAEAVTAVKE
jgi:Flp pilus assembly protein TadD